jgi:hypothetical protein
MRATISWKAGDRWRISADDGMLAHPRQVDVVERMLDHPSSVNLARQIAVKAL